MAYDYDKSFLEPGSVTPLMDRRDRQKEEMDKRRTIEFSRSLDPREMDDLFGHIVDNGYSQIRYSLTHRRAVFGTEREDNGDYGIGLEGEIESGNGRTYNIPFDCRADLAELFTFDAIEFRIEQGQALEDIPRRTVRVWDDVRELVDNYFS